MSRCEPGERPPGWWRFESARPDLAATGGDIYAHLYGADRDFDGRLIPNLSPDNPKLERARERLRFLRDSGELTPGEVDEIHRRAKNRAIGWRWQWRSELLREGSRR